MPVAFMFFAMATAFAVLLCLYAWPLAVTLDVVDEPSGAGGHKRHELPTPAVGGVILGIVSLIVFCTSMPWSQTTNVGVLLYRASAAAAVLACMLLGFLDDRNHIPAVRRLGITALIFGSLLVLVPQLQVHAVFFPSVGFGLDLASFSLPFTILCLVALQNAVNMADGKNGLVLGMAVVWSVFFLSHALSPMVPTLAGLYQPALTMTYGPMCGVRWS